MGTTSVYRVLSDGYAFAAQIEGFAEATEKDSDVCSPGKTLPRRTRDVDTVRDRS
jgi:hypothetical protein